MESLDSTIKSVLSFYLEQLETHFQGDVVFYLGEIHLAFDRHFRDNIEKLKNENPEQQNDRLVLFLNTPGGSAETVEKMVEIIRYHYKEVYFVVPDYAFSAGTIFCMSGDKIFMDYSSSLGPIDPQVYNGSVYVPALGYLDQVDRLIKKAQDGTLTNAELIMLQNQDLAMLNLYEQQKNLTVTLLKKWLVEYKFKNWTEHRSDPIKQNQIVTDEEKASRAEMIAVQLGDNKLWHSHGRHIGVDTLRKILRLEIEDYSDDLELRMKIRQYNDLITNYLGRERIRFFIHTRAGF
jgi:hypothetical protein